MVKTLGKQWGIPMTSLVHLLGCQWLFSRLQGLEVIKLIRISPNIWAIYIVHITWRVQKLHYLFAILIHPQGKPSVRAEFVLIRRTQVLMKITLLRGIHPFLTFLFTPPTSSASKLIKFPSYPPVVSLTWHPTWGNSEIFIVSKKCRRC